MSTLLDLTPPAEAALGEQLQRDTSTLEGAERRAELLTGGLVALIAVGLPLVAGVRGGGSPVAIVAAALVIALAMHVRFDIPGGYTVPTQLGFVPLLVAAPPSLLPAIVVLSLVAGRLPTVWSGELRPSRLLSVVPNCHFALGPALLLCSQPAAVADWPLPVVLLAAFAAQVAADLLVSCWREWRVSGTGLGEQVRDALPVYAVDLALTAIGGLCAALVAEAPLVPLAVVPLLGILVRFSRARHDHMESLAELNGAYRGTALVLGDVIEADDGYTGAHSKGVVDLALAVGLGLGLPSSRQRDLEFGAMLHDVGKVAIPKDVINKPGPLDDEEWALMRTHPARGQEMLDRVGGFMTGVGWIVRAHHERWDGGGYPDGLRGDAIPLEARIIACCDTFNAMTTDRPYRRALGVDVATEELRAQAGRQFDPEIVGAVLRALGSPGPHSADAPAPG